MFQTVQTAANSSLLLPNFFLTLIFRKIPKSMSYNPFQTPSHLSSMILINASQIQKQIVRSKNQSCDITYVHLEASLLPYIIKAKLYIRVLSHWECILAEKNLIFPMWTFLQTNKFYMLYKSAWRGDSNDVRTNIICRVVFDFCIIFKVK